MDPVHTAFLHALSSGYQFTEAFGVVPELDWMTTEAGMVYIATRRVGELVWVRVCDFMPCRRVLGLAVSAWPRDRGSPSVARAAYRAARDTPRRSRSPAH